MKPPPQIFWCVPPLRPPWMYVSNCEYLMYFAASILFSTSFYSSLFIVKLFLRFFAIQFIALLVGEKCLSLAIYSPNQIGLILSICIFLTYLFCIFFVITCIKSSNNLTLILYYISSWIRRRRYEVKLSYISMQIIYYFPDSVNYCLPLTFQSHAAIFECFFFFTLLHFVFLHII